MKSFNLTAFMLLSVWGIIPFGCNDAQFGSSSPKRSAETSTGSANSSSPRTSTDPTTPPNGIDDNPLSNNPQDCIDGDVINYKFDEQIQKCIDEGKLWNFDVDTCTNMRKATYTCSFDGFIERLKELKVPPTPLLTEAKDAGPDKALIVGCGESQDKKTILIQWFLVPENNKIGCDFERDAGSIITGCYGKDSGPVTASPEEKTRIVLDCMNGFGS